MKQEMPKMQIYNSDGTVTEVTPCKLWSPKKTKDIIIEIRENYAKGEYIHSYVDIDGNDEEWHKAHNAMAILLSENERLNNILKELSDWHGWDKEE